jgi:hypothetical protein
MEDDLTKRTSFLEENLKKKWKKTSNKMEDDLKTKIKNGRQTPKKWKTT